MRRPNWSSSVLAWTFGVDKMIRTVSKPMPSWAKEWLAQAWQQQAEEEVSCLGLAATQLVNLFGSTSACFLKSCSFQGVQSWSKSSRLQQSRCLAVQDMTRKMWKLENAHLYAHGGPSTNSCVRHSGMQHLQALLRGQLCQLHLGSLVHKET